MQRSDEATGLSKFFQQGTTTDKIKLSPSTVLAKGDLFKGLKPDLEASQALHWWHSFKLQPKSVCRPLIEEVVTTDASKEGYGGHMNKLSF